MSRILAADDNKMVRVFYEGIIGYLGQECEICKDGLEALEAFKRNPADLVILDYDMPGMDGFECCKAIRRLPDGVMVPIVIVSSHDDENHVARGLDAGATDYLAKPVKEAHLIAKLRNYLKASSFRKGECDLIKEHAVIAGRYRVERMLGSGSHSTVFLVSDIKDGDRRLALKMLKECASGAEMSKPFFETAGKIKALESGNVVKIIDMGQTGGRLYAIMECMDGGDLAGILKKRGRLTEPEAAAMALDVAKALAAFHGIGLIHLDVKPENILRDSTTGAYKLADFGMITMRSTSTMPLNAEIWSTLAYVPPEYFSDKAEVGLSSDVYSLGVTLYQSMTGDNPFLCERPAITMFRHMNLTPPLLSDCDRTISPRMTALVSSMMDKSMELRPTAAETVKLLEDIIAKPEAISPQLVKEEAGRLQAGPALKTLEGAKAKPMTSIGLGVEKGDKVKNLHMMTAIAIMLALICGMFGYIINGEIFKSGVEQGALLAVDCVKCGTLDKRRIADISKAHCAKCGGKLGYAMKCAACSNVFPCQMENIEGITDRKAAIASIEKAKRCPKCGSGKTDPVSY